MAASHVSENAPFHDGAWQFLFFQVQFVDVILCNRYYAWYQDCGQTQLISRQLEIELRNWFNTFHKPVVQSEYGADTIAGLHRVGFTQIFKSFFCCCCCCYFVFFGVSKELNFLNGRQKIAMSQYVCFPAKSA